MTRANHESNRGNMTKESIEKEYFKAIRKVGGVLSMYTSHKKYPLYGFGGKYPYGTKVSDCFALNGDIYNPEINGGIEGVIKQYTHVNKSYVHWLNSPRKIGGVLEQVNNFCEYSGHMSKAVDPNRTETGIREYNVLLVLADGDFDDQRVIVD